jgi:hypothetical protein
VKKRFEIPNVAIRSIPEDRKSNRESRPEGLRSRVSSNDDGQSRAIGGSTWDEIKIDKLSIAHDILRVSCCLRQSHVVSDESTGK